MKTIRILLMFAICTTLNTSIFPGKKQVKFYPPLALRSAPRQLSLGQNFKLQILPKELIKIIVNYYSEDAKTLVWLRRSSKTIYALVDTKYLQKVNEWHRWYTTPNSQPINLNGRPDDLIAMSQHFPMPRIRLRGVNDMVYITYFIYDMKIKHLILHDFGQFDLLTTVLEQTLGDGSRLETLTINEDETFIEQHYFLEKACEQNNIRLITIPITPPTTPHL